MTNTKGLKKSVHIAGKTVDAIRTRYTPGNENFSEAVNMAWDRYRALIAVELKTVDLTTGEWFALFEACKTTNTRKDAATTAKILLALVADQEGTPELFDKIRGMSLAQRIAIIDMIERFLSVERDNNDNPEATIRKLLSTV